MVRYLTRSCVAVDAHQAERLAAGDGTQPHQLEVALDVDLVHVENGWALWSDGRVTTSTGLPEALWGVRSLSAAAVELISNVKHGTPGSPAGLTGGWGALACVAEVEGDDLLEEYPNDPPYDPPQLRRLRVRLVDGTKRMWWLRTAGSAEGVHFELSDAPGPGAAAAAGLN